MLPYLRIASVLEEASSEDRSRKVKLAVGLLQETPAEDLPKAVRLLTGALWPPWEGLDMRAGPDRGGPQCFEGDIISGAA